MTCGGLFVLFSLTCLAALNALGAAVRFRPAGRAELGIVALTVGLAELSVPVVVLGYTEQLTPAKLGLLSSLIFGGVLLSLRRGDPWLPFLRECREVMVSLAKLPFDALRETARARSAALIGVLWAEGIIVYAFLLAVRYPVSTWDGFMYHQPIIGFAIQNHGFSPVNLPLALTTQATNGYPRFCEATSIWFCIFTDRTLEELPNVLGGVLMMLSMFALARRYGDRILALALASVLVLVPHSWAQLPIVCLDVYAAAFAIVALYFATRPDLRIRDACVASVSMMVLTGTKASAYVMVPPLVLVMAVRLFTRHRRERPLAATGVVLGAAVVVAAVAVAPLRQNWLAFHNPFWPLTFESNRLGIQWHGLATVQFAVSAIPLAEVFNIMYEIPTGIRSLNGYGIAFSWIVFPLGVVSIGAWTLSRLARRIQDPLGANLGWALLLLAIGIATAPTLNPKNARYNLHLVAAIMAPICWLLAKRSWLRAREGVLGAAVALSVIPFFWLDPPDWAFQMTDDPKAMLLFPFGSRAYFPKPSFDPMAKQRFEELHRGDRVAFDSDVVFIGALWNFDYSNEVHFVQDEDPKAFLRAVEAYAPKWVAVGQNGRRDALMKSGRWVSVGSLTPAQDTEIFRRKTPVSPRPG